MAAPVSLGACASFIYTQSLRKISGLQAREHGPSPSQASGLHQWLSERSGGRSPGVPPRFSCCLCRCQSSLGSWVLEAADLWLLGTGTQWGHILCSVPPRRLYAIWGIRYVSGAGPKPASVALLGTSRGPSAACPEPWRQPHSLFPLLCRQTGNIEPVVLPLLWFGEVRPSGCGPITRGVSPGGRQH